MRIKEKGLTVDIDTHTGNVSLRYIYPIKQHSFMAFKDMESIYNIVVETYTRTNNRGKLVTRTQCTYLASGNSNAVFSRFRIIQKQLMLLSRTCKIQQLHSEIASLKNNS